MRNVEIPQSRVRFGIAVGDITPPVGIYCRMWGAARHDQATGVHRPLQAAAVALGRPVESAESVESAAIDSDGGDDDGSSGEIVLVTLDHCLLRAAEMNGLLESIGRRANLAQEKIVVLFSHTHSSGLMSLDRSELPGGEMIGPYLDQLAATVADLVTEARERMQPAAIVYGTGRCDLAVQRDFWDEEAGQFVCGFNPTGLADDTVVVARISDDSDTTLATLVNYACHPTTLAWQNSLISPDFPGAMREVVEAATGAPCVFLQGASGDLAPREQYTGEVAVADRNGRQLGHAALAAFAGLPRAGQRYAYAGPVVSGATLGTWRYQGVARARQREILRWHLRRTTVDLPYRADAATAGQARQELARWETAEAESLEASDDARAADCRAMAERARRRLMVLDQLPTGEKFPLPVTLLRLGDACLVTVEGEHYQQLQTELRKRFPNRPLLIATLANGSRPMYLPTADAYGKGIYQETVAVLAAGCLETVVDYVASEIQAV